MSLTHQIFYNKIRANSAKEQSDKLIAQGTEITADIEKGIDAYAQAYAEIYCSLSFSDVARYRGGSKQEIYNWAKARELFETAYPGGTLADFMSQDFQNLLFEQFFLQGENGNYIPNPDSGFITDGGTSISIESHQADLNWLVNGGNGNYVYPQEEFSELFLQAKNTAPKRVDPLLVDLDGDGIETTSLQNGVFFDHENDGFAENSCWVGADDGILVLDKNNNGIIDNGSELFGDQFILSDGTKAASGFDALASLDSNADLVIDSGDEMFNQIKILKGDGTLLTLAEAGIASISLTYSNSTKTDINGNRQLRIGSYTTTEGKNFTIADYNFSRDTINSISTNIVDVSATIEALPDANGFGLVDTLHQAMAKDTTGSLQALVQSFVNETNIMNRHNLVKDIILKWTGVENVVEGSRGGAIDAQELAALEKFMGENFVGVSNSTNPNTQAANILNSAFSELVEYVYAQLASQSHLKSLYDLITVDIDSTTNKITLDLSAVATTIKSNILSNSDTGKNLLSEFDRTLKSLGIVDSTNYQEYYDTISELGDEYKLLMDISDKTAIYGTDGVDDFDGTAKGEAYFTGNGNDKVYSRQGDDIIYAGAGNDNINACYGNDTIDGGAGRDTMYGGDGNDVYYVDQTSDKIVEYADEGEDTIYSSVTYTLPSNVENIILTGSANINATGNSLNNEITGNDGNNILRAGSGYVNRLNGGKGADTMYGTIYVDTYYVDNPGDVIVEPGVGKEGRTDTVFSTISYSLENTYIEQLFLQYDSYEDLYGIGNEYDNAINGTRGNNLLIGNGGDDSLSGREGIDTLIGGLGDDIYSVDNVNDVIIENANEGIDDVWAFGIDYTLTNDCNCENLIVYGDNLTAVGNDYDNTISGEGADNLLIGNGGNDVFNGEVYDGENFGMLYGGDYGADTLIGGIGDDTYFYYGGGEVIIENENEGIDRVVSNTDCVLPDNVENLYIKNYEDSGIKITGNNLDNMLKGAYLGCIFEGKTGNDSLYGKTGDDTYVFNSGDNNDIIIEEGGNDKIILGEDITKSNIAIYQDGNNLIIDYGTELGTDSILIQNQNTTEGQIESIELSDGSYISNTDINQIIQNMTAYAQNNAIEFTGIDSVKNNADLMNLVSVAWHS